MEKELTLDKEEVAKEFDKQILEEFLKKHSLRISMFRKDNPGKPLPIFRDKNGLPIWMSRKSRRG